MGIARDGSFEEFVRTHTDSLWRQAWMLTGHREDAEDLLQETLVRMALAWRRVDLERQPLAYARTTMTRLHVSRWRAARRRVQFVLGRHPEAGDDGRDLAAVEDSAQIHQLLETLGPRERAVLILTYLDDLSDDAIAEVLGAATGTIRSLRSRALARLRAAGLTDHSPTPLTDRSLP